MGDLSHSLDPWTPDRVLYAPAPPGWLLPRLQASPWLARLGAGPSARGGEGRDSGTSCSPLAEGLLQRTPDHRKGKLSALSQPPCPGIPVCCLIREAASPPSYPSARSAFPDCPVQFCKPGSRSLPWAGHFSLQGTDDLVYLAAVCCSEFPTASSHQALGSVSPLPFQARTGK